MSAIHKTDQGGVKRCQKKGSVLNRGERKIKFMQWPEKGKGMRHTSAWNKSILGRNKDSGRSMIVMLKVYQKDPVS